MKQRTVRALVCLFALITALPVQAERGRRRGRRGAAGVVSSILGTKGASRPIRTEMVPMRDGIRLATDIILPSAKGKYPVILMRTPYGKGGGSGMADVGNVAAKFGYAVVIQDHRGRFDSEGEDYPVFVSCGWYELQDGYDTIEWIARQPWCNGKIGQFGASALGISANATAPSRPPHLACQFVVVAASDIYRQAATWNGTPRKSLTEGWVKGTKLDPRNLDMWKKHPSYDDFWRRYNPELVAHRVNVPACYVGGWYDIFSQGTIDSFVMVNNRGDEGARGKCRLVMGPWAHGTFNTLKYTADATIASQVSTMMNWFHKHLKGLDMEPNAPAVRYYVMGACGEEDAPGNVWRGADTWPLPSKQVRYYFHKDGTLSRQRPAEHRASVTYKYDPADPVRTIGGGNLKLKKGPMDQRPVEDRDDVILFTTPKLTKPVEVTGRVRVKLWASSHCRDTDFTAKLTDVYPDGRSMLVLDGVISARYRESMSTPKLMKPGKIYVFDIDLWSTSIIFNKGHRIRVAISSSNHPRFAANPNMSRPQSQETRVARNTIYFDRNWPSHIVLPRPDRNAWARAK